MRDRAIAEARIDPNFNFTSTPRTTMLNEVANILLVFSGGSEDGGANTLQVNAMFVDERAPFDKGYVRPQNRIFPANITTVGSKINASLPLDIPTAPLF